MSQDKRSWPVRFFCNWFGIPYRGLEIRWSLGHASDAEAPVIYIGDQNFDLLLFLKKRFEATPTMSVGGFGIERWHDLHIDGYEFNLNDQEGFGWFLFAKDRNGTETAKKVYAALKGQAIE